MFGPSQVETFSDYDKRLFLEKECRDFCWLFNVAGLVKPGAYSILDMWLELGGRICIYPENIRMYQRRS